MLRLARLMQPPSLARSSCLGCLCHHSVVVLVAHYNFDIFLENRQYCALIPSGHMSIRRVPFEPAPICDCSQRYQYYRQSTQPTPNSFKIMWPASPQGGLWVSHLGVPVVDELRTGKKGFKTCGSLRRKELLRAQPRPVIVIRKFLCPGRRRVGRRPVHCIFVWTVVDFDRGWVGSRRG